MTEQATFDYGLIERVDTSECANILSGSPRYDRYRAPDVSPEEWIALLDCDFDNKQHLFKTALLASLIAQMDHSNPEAAKRAIETSLIHDAPEAITTDVTYDLKTIEFDHEEADILVTQVMDGTLNVPLELAKDASEIMKSKAAFSPSAEQAVTDEAVVVFDLAERIGYLLSAKTAWQTSYENATLSEDQAERLRWLAGNVMANTYGTLLTYVTQHDRNSARFVASELHDTFGEILLHVTNPTTVQKHREYYAVDGLPDVKVQKLETALQDAHASWKNMDIEQTHSFDS